MKKNRISLQRTNALPSKLGLLELGMLVVSTLFLATFIACPGPDWPKCENDDHCKENDGDEVNYHCVFGQCQECGRDSDCGKNEQCNKKVFKCEAKCSDDASCESGFMCESGGCIKGERAPEVDENACVETGDCKSGFMCSEGSCVEDPDATSEEGGGTDDGSTSAEVTPECEQAGTIFFGFNTFNLTPEARESLNTFAKCMEDNADWKVVIEGHADERGTPEFNMSLGEKRANEVRKYMTNLGVAKSRMRSLSYGEERPVDSDSSENAWTANRRAEFRVK
ncbi:MAG: OmpA family protein [Deltaproteobacteria bacterium]|nr:OmpA family protein [Deltaproteobacteria bacterium]